MTKFLCGMKNKAHELRTFEQHSKGCSDLRSSDIHLRIRDLQTMVDDLDTHIHAHRPRRSR